jgi:type IV pilus assembly protein PilB
LHFERGEHDLRIRFRVDGVLHVQAAPPSHLRDALIARIKSLAGLDIAERRLPQDGRLTLRVTAQKIEDFRVSTLPTVHGEKVVLRRLDTLASGVDLSMLGLSLSQQTQLTEALVAPHGMILVTGPTGSGKTLSLFCLLQMLNTPEMNICTVEDPVEIRLPGLTQVNVQEKAGLTFASVLRAFLRQDPDVLMIGEIRDAETADIAVKAAQTGHRVLSTLHTNDAPSAVTRLRDIGIAPYRLASSLTLITAQRLIRRLCPACRRPDPLDAHAWVHSTGSDCPQCSGLGYRGRIGVHQLMPISEGLRQLIAADQSAVALDRLAREEGMQSLHEAALAFVLNGQTSLSEAIQLEDRRR